MTALTKQMVYAATLAAVGGWPVIAHASQGPGTGAGTASQAVQLGMAVAVYGGAGLVLVASLIGAARSARSR